jgi:SAM-dependent methyltransferase
MSSRPVLDSLRRRQTLASFDYQWGEIPAGDAMLSDPWFAGSVDRIVSEELLGVERRWFAGREALDAGCGGGRWTLGLLRLGCRVTAVDFSPRALESTRSQMARLAPDAVREGRLATERVDLLSPPDSLARRRFDLVFSFGVLHHTGDTREALGRVAAMTKDDGLLFVYLYGAGSLTRLQRAALVLARAGLAPLGFRAKRALLARVLPGRDTHQAFDLLSPLVNDRRRPDEVEGWLRALGFSDVARTIPHDELFLRAARERCSARPFRPLASPPYWLERYRRGGR